MLAAAGVLEERHDVGIRHRDAVAPVVGTGEAVAVGVGQAVEVGVRHDEPVGHLGDVLVEADTDLDEPRHRRPHLGPRVGRQVMAGQADVALREVEQSSQLAGESRGLRRRRQLGDRRGHGRIEGQVDAPLLEALGHRMAGGADLGVGAHEGEEAGRAERLGDDAAGGVQRQQRRGDRPRHARRDGGGDDGVGLGDRPIGFGGNGVGGGVVVVEPHGSDATGGSPARGSCSAPRAATQKSTWPIV